MDKSSMPSEARHIDRFVAISVALCAVFMATTKVKDDNLVQAMLQAKSDAVDSWNEYQSTKIKKHVTELGLQQINLLGKLIPSESAAVEQQISSYQSQIKKYDVEQESLKSKAKELEGQYDALNFRDDQFDMSDAAMNVSIGLFAICALTKERWLFRFAWIFALVGFLMGIAGLFGLPIHSAFLAKLLS